MPFKSILKYLAAALLFFAVGAQALMLGLPLIAESIARGRLEQALGGPGPDVSWDFSVDKIGLTRILVRNIRYGDDLAVDTAELRYGWEDGQVRVSKLVLSGGHLVVHGDGSGGFRSCGMAFPREAESGPAAAGRPDIDLVKLADWIPRQIRIKHFRVSARLGEGEIQIPADLMVRLDPEQGRGDFRLAIRPMGQRLDIIAGMDITRALERGMDEGITRVEARGSRIDPGCLARLLPVRLQKAEPTGPVDIRLISQDLKTWTYDASGAGIRADGWPDIRIGRVRGSVVMPHDENGLHIVAKGDMSIRGYGMSELGLNFGFTGALDQDGNPSGKLSLESRRTDALVLVPADWPGAGKNMPEQIRISSPEMSLSVSAGPARQTALFKMAGKRVQGKSKARAFGSEGISLSVRAEGNILDDSSGLEVCSDAAVRKPAAASGRFSVGFRNLSERGCIRLYPGKDGGVLVKNGEVTLDGSGLEAGADADRLTGSEFKVHARINGEDGRLSVALDAGLDQIGAVSGEYAASARRAGISGKIRLDPGGMVAALDTRLKGMSLKLPDIELSGMDLRLPLVSPFRSSIRPGRIEVKRAVYGGRISAAAEAELVQTGDRSFSGTGRIISPDLPDTAVDLGFQAGADAEWRPWADVRLVSDALVVTRDELTRFFPETSLSGTFRMPLSADIGLALKHNAITTRAVFGVRDGSLMLPDFDLRAEGISGRLAFNDLLTPESLPGQSLSVKSIEAGQFRFDNGRLRFSIEDGRFVNIENIRFNWCNGLVSTESVRLPSEDDRLALTLFCDRLEMDSLLRQIGAFDAEGGGTLSGRIPVVYNNGEISFENGFLFSTPGQGGRVFVKDLDRMMAGFPKNTPEFSQLDLAAEALKDFEYKWAKLRMETRGETLEVRMELDGKPAAVLPFEYKRDISSFVRVDASSPGSRFQGVKLDVNIKLPFNRVMKFGNKLKQMLD